jgi:hypothetical protein
MEQYTYGHSFIVSLVSVGIYILNDIGFAMSGVFFFKFGLILFDSIWFSLI